MADTINILSLYSGSGMHDEAVCAGLRLLGYVPRILGYVEREASAAAWLLGRMEAQALESAPVFVGDLADLADGDCDDMRGLVDILVASPPCQPYSSAGAKRGNADERSFGGDGRGPLHHTVRIIDRVRPALVWFENVPEWVTGGSFRGFGDALSRVGYAIQDPIFLAAEDVGAPHQRERVFILAAADAERIAWRRDFTRWRPSERAAFARTGEELADGDHARPRPGIEGIEGIEGIGRDRLADGCGQLAERPGRGRRERGQSPGRDGLAARSYQELGIAGGPRREGAELGATSADARATARRSTAESGRDIPLFPPSRDDYRRWAQLFAGGLDPALAPCVERGLPALAHGLAVSNSDLLRLGGNGVVPLAAAVAFVEAVRRLTGR